ncbi:MAG TPA: class I SAM-dependent methyltransferase [Desulfobacterales bacterium]|nr:class I SAM-dependent methyltransferase [Desulfobacterales bacterium]
MKNNMREENVADMVKNYTNLYKIIEQIAALSPFQKKAINRYCNIADKRYFEFAESLANRMLKVVDCEDGYEYIAKTYLWYTKTIRIEEMYFRKEGNYRYSDYEEVFRKVYGRDDYMIDYVVGLGMTQIFWPNHWEIFKFFLDSFIPKVKDFSNGAEVGVGHGLFHSELLRGCPEMQSKLIDISPSALKMTQKMIEATGVDSKRAEPIICDIQKEIPVEDESLDALLMGELIEHIQDGEAVMSNMATKMKTSGFCYFSTAANSPAEDHILLFRTVKEIRDFIDKCKWRVLDEHLGTLRQMTIEESEKDGHNINYAAVLAVK